MSGQQAFRVMVTRPKPEGELLCRQLQIQGFDTVYLPVIEIQALSDLSLLRQQIAHLGEFDWAIFISRSAVRTSQALIKEQWPQFPERLQVAAIGEGTAHALKEAGLPLNLYPLSEWNSEGLLALAPLQNLAGKKLAVFCGEGGRELLISTLQARGAQVTRLVSYQRLLPKVDIKPYRDLLADRKIDVILCTSVEGLANLRNLFGESEWPRLKKIPLVLVSERIMIQAKEFGFETCFLAKNASHAGIAETLQMIRIKR